MKTSTIALVLTTAEDTLGWVETLYDREEISLLEAAIRSREISPLDAVYQHREIQFKADDEFGMYVEELLSRPFLDPKIQKTALQWLRSKIKIEQYQKGEKEAAHVIAEYAFRLYKSDRENRDFFLTGPNSQVRVRIFVLADASVQSARDSKAS